MHMHLHIYLHIKGDYSPCISLYMGAQVRVNFGPNFKYKPTLNKARAALCDDDLYQMDFGHNTNNVNIATASLSSNENIINSNSNNSNVPIFNSLRSNIDFGIEYKPMTEAALPQLINVIMDDILLKVESRLEAQGCWC